MARHITRAKNHVFKNSDLNQVLHAAEGNTMLSKTKGAVCYIETEKDIVLPKWDWYRWLIGALGLGLSFSLRVGFLFMGQWFGSRVRSIDGLCRRTLRAERRLGRANPSFVW